MPRPQTERADHPLLRHRHHPCVDTEMRDPPGDSKSAPGKRAVADGEIPGSGGHSCSPAGAAFVCIKNVPDGYVALVYWVGSDEPEIRLQGPFFIIPFIQKVELFDARAQHTELRCLCVTRDGMLIRVRVRIHWAIDIGQLRSVKSLLTIEPVQSLEERITEWLAPRLGMQESAQLPANLGQLSRDLLNHLVSNPYGAEGAGILVAQAFIAGFDGPITRRSTARRT